MFLTAVGFTFALLAFFCAGFCVAHKWHQNHFDKDCFYCHECIVCKRDKDAAWCRSKDHACIKCIARALPTLKEKAKKRMPGYMGDVNGAGCDPSTA